MKIDLSNPPRIFHIPLPNGERITLSDCAHITLEADEQITLFTHNGNEYDITRKDWGYYATPSLNRRLTHFNLRAVLVRGLNDTFFINLVERSHEEAFQHYLDRHNIRVVTWLDTLEALEHLESLMQADRYSPQGAITRFAKERFRNSAPTLLAIGNTPADFASHLTLRGWSVASASTFEPPSQKYDVICFDHVLENDGKASRLVQMALPFINEDGFIFVTVSTHSFTVATLALEAEQGGGEVIHLERQDTTLFAFLIHKDS